MVSNIHMLSHGESQTLGTKGLARIESRLLGLNELVFCSILMSAELNPSECLCYLYRSKAS